MLALVAGITVVIPTYKRTADLDRCLRAIQRQTLTPCEILITYRGEDEESRAYLARSDRPCRGARLILCEEPGVVYALNLAIDAVQSEYFAITDDDSVPREDWLARIVAHFKGDAQAAGVGGKDHVSYSGIWLDGEVPVVGKMRWFGLPIGYHHLGAGPARYVDTLKGVNLAFRRAAFETLRLDPRLRGKGAQVGWEMALCLTLRARGYKLIYDPAVFVQHFPGERPIEENRAFFNPVALGDELFNRTLITIEYLRTESWGWVRELLFWLYVTLRGTRKSPGLVLLTIGLVTRYPNTWERFRVTMRAYRDVWGAAGR